MMRPLCVPAIGGTNSEQFAPTITGTSSLSLTPNLSGQVITINGTHLIGTISSAGFVAFAVTTQTTGQIKATVTTGATSGSGTVTITTTGGTVTSSAFTW
jgi:hypothetical protein